MRHRDPTDAADVIDRPTLSATPQRIASVDALRGVTILTMVFVNDVGPAAPAWTHHIQPPDADGMTVADVVFPAFLFIVGMSIPLAFERSQQCGASVLRQLGHVFVRTAALLLMGVVQINRAADISLGKYWWGLLAFTSIILAWCVIPKTSGPKRNVLRVLKGLGVLTLIVLLAMYRREPLATTIAFYGDVPDWVWLRTGWWGILGLIGWAYLITSLIYLLLGARREWLMGAMAILVGVNLVSHTGGFHGHLDSKAWLTGLRPWIVDAESAVASLGSYVNIGSVIGAHPSITMAGCLLGTILLPGVGLASQRQRIRWALLFAAGLFIAGAVTDPVAGINKIAATPTWCLWSAAITTVIWASLSWLMDIHGYSSWSVMVRPAGANPLIAYLLHPIVLWCLSLSGMSSVVAYKASAAPWIAMLGSLTMALTICALTGLIARSGIRVRI